MKAGAYYISLLSLFFLISVTSGCANLRPAQDAQHVFANVHFLGATALAYSSSGKYLASGGLKGDIALWQTTPPAMLMRLNKHQDSIRALVYASDQRLISAGEDGYIIIWDITNRKPLVEQRTSAVSSLDLKQNILVSGHADGWLRAWHYPNLKQIREVHLRSSVIALSRHNDVYAVATEEGQLALYDSQFRKLQELQQTGLAAHDVRFSPDGKWLIAGSWFKLRVWEIASGKQFSIPTDHTGLITSVDVSPDAKRVVSLGRHTDSAIRVWQADGWQVERRYHAHELCGAMIRFSPDGRHMASVSDDESVRLYDLEAAYNPHYPKAEIAWQPF